MDFSSLFPSTDNLFKFLFLGGLIMVFTAMIYPLQKQQEREMEIINHNQQVELINQEIKKIEGSIVELKQKTKNALTECQKLVKKSQLNPKTKLSSIKQVAAIKDDINTSYELIKKQNNDINTKLIVIKFNEDKIKLLERYVATYAKYSCWLLWLGIPLAFLGLLLWTISTIKTEKLKTKELNKH